MIRYEFVVQFHFAGDHPDAHSVLRFEHHEPTIRPDDLACKIDAHVVDTYPAYVGDEYEIQTVQVFKVERKLIRTLALSAS